MTAISLKKTHREYERALTAVFGLLIRGGVRHGATSRLSDRAFKSAIANAQTLGDSGSGELATLPFLSRERLAAALTNASRASFENFFGVIPRDSNAEVSSTSNC